MAGDAKAREKNAAAMKASLRSRLMRLPFWESMARAFCALTGETKPASRKSMVDAVVDSVAWDQVNFHHDYLAALTPERQTALNSYTSIGHAAMNTYLRTGKAKLSANYGDGGLLGGDALWLNSSSVKQLVRNPDSIKELVKGIASKIATRAEQVLNRSVDALREDLGHVKTMEAIVNEAPPLTVDLVLWRGEYLVEKDFAPAQSSSERERRDHIGGMNKLKPGDKFTKQDFSSFSMCVYVSADFMSSSECCLFRLKLKAGQRALMLDVNSAYSEYEVILPPGTRFTVKKVMHVHSPVGSAKFKLLDLELA